MVGPLTPNEPLADTAQMEAVPKGGLAGFLSTTLGKVIIGGAVVVLIAGALAAIAFFYFLSQAPDDPGLVVPTNTGGTSVAVTQTAEPPAQRPSPRLESTFSFRNVFRPTARPTVPASSTTDASGTAGGADIPADTLFLQSVSVVDGEEVATFLWNGQTFTAGEGDVLSGTPWQVLSIEGSTVVMLYGDSRVTLVVGQGVGK